RYNSGRPSLLATCSWLHLVYDSGYVAMRNNLQELLQSLVQMVERRKIQPRFTKNGREDQAWNSSRVSPFDFGRYSSREVESCVSWSANVSISEICAPRHRMTPRHES